MATVVRWPQPECAHQSLPVSPHLVVEEPVPDDRYHAIYFAMLLAGVGFLLPYNSFITDVDYLHHKYPGGPLRHPHSPQRRLSTLFLARGLLGIPRGGTLPGDVAWREPLMWFLERADYCITLGG